MEPLTQAQIDHLKTRWERDTVIQLVVALNEGAPIQQILAKVITPEDTPPARGTLDLRYIDLSHQNLRGPWKADGDRRIRAGIDLSGADLTGADLSWAILPRAVLSGCILEYADLNHAELIYADLSNADLTDANLKAAWLLYTRLSGARATDAQLKTRRNLGQMDFDYHAFQR